MVEQPLALAAVVEQDRPAAGKLARLDVVEDVADKPGPAGVKAVLVDRYQKELHYDYVLRAQAASGDDLAGVVFNDVPEAYMEEALRR